MGSILRCGRRRLTEQGLEEAHLEAEVLLMRLVGISRAHLHSHLDGPISEEDEAAYQSWIDRRAAREPLAYITGVREFFGLDFYVDRRVLIPRPETELLVEECLRILGRGRTGPSAPTGDGRPSVPIGDGRPSAPTGDGRPSAPTGDGRPSAPTGDGRRSAPTGDGRPSARTGDRLSSPVLADIGAGSGAIAVVLACRLPDARIYATDVSTDALEVARLNCLRHGVQERVELRPGDLLEPVKEPVDIILANLPYIPDSVLPTLAPEVSVHEPRLALAGGADGLDLVRRLLAQAPGRLRPGGRLLLEIGSGQGARAARAAADALPDSSIRIMRDLAGLERVLVIELAS
ncbi:MAG: HemK/PrmC family methyltransferase [Dehalococcoidia bacterium]|nr:HemK/PrmC family methyltransferase [Dehalococcoidia bacterium]